MMIAFARPSVGARVATSNVVSFGFLAEGNAPIPPTVGTGFQNPITTATYPRLIRFGFAPRGSLGTQAAFDSADGPPWVLTKKERERLEAYRREIAELYEQEAKRHRERLDDILADVELATYGPPPAPEAIEPPPTQVIRQRVKSLRPLPPLPKYSIYNANLSKLKAIVAEQERLAFEIDEEDAEILLLH